MLRKFVANCLVAVVVLGFAAQSRADLIIGNLGAATANDGVSQSINFTDRYAVSFTMGTQAYSLSDAQIRLTFDPPDSTRFQLESDAGGHPSNAGLVTFTNPTFGSGLNTYTFTAGSPFTLAAGTKYWLVGSTTSTTESANWAITLLLTNPSGSGASFGSYEETTTSGATWFNSATTTQFQLNGTAAEAVPEPSSLIFATIAGTCGGFSYWRRRRPKTAQAT